jgi:hypothetical protein
MSRFIGEELPQITGSPVLAAGVYKNRLLHRCIVVNRSKLINGDMLHNPNLMRTINLMRTSSSKVSVEYAPPRPYSHSAEKCLRLYIAMVIFTLLYISFDGIKSLSLYDITI